MKKSYLVLSFILFFVGFGLQAQTNDPRKIDITTLAQLDAVRYDLDGNGRADNTADVDKYNGSGAPFTVAQTRCTPGPCRGYELRNDLDFSAAASYAGAISPEWSKTTGPGGWVPIGDEGPTAGQFDDRPFTATFEGNGQKISNLYINTSTLAYVGLFGGLGSGAEV